jgi:tetratricopeptide (TPR) repeat protein
MHAFEEAGGVYSQLGDKVEEAWPEAVGYYKRALHYYDSAIAMNPRYLVARLGAAMVLRKLYRFGAAMEHCKAIRDFAETKSPVEAAACLLAELMEDTHAYQDCVKFCDGWIPKLVVEVHRRWMAKTRARVLADHFMIGKEYGGQHAFVEDAVQYFWQEVERDHSRDSECLLYWARINEWLGHQEIAARVYAQIHERAPLWWLAHMHESLFLYRKGELAAAIDHARRATSLAPYRPEPLDNEAFLYRSMGRPSEAAAAATGADAIFRLRKELCA